MTCGVFFFEPDPSISFDERRLEKETTRERLKKEERRRRTKRFEYAEGLRQDTVNVVGREGGGTDHNILAYTWQSVSLAVLVGPRGFSIAARRQLDKLIPRRPPPHCPPRLSVGQCAVHMSPGGGQYEFVI